jgi:hypothetical protein
VLKSARTIRVNLDRAQPDGDLNLSFMRRTLGWLRIATPYVDLRIA